jgi:predicted permease
MAIVAITAVIFGLAPSLQARREDPKTALAGAGGRASLSVSQRRMLNGFVIAEVALAAVLLVSSGLLFRAYQRVRAVDPGFQVDNVMSFQLSLPSVRYPDSAAIQAFQNRLTDQLTALAGVTSAGLINCPPLGCHQGNFFEIEGAKPRLPGAANPVTLTLVATPGVFKALGIRLIKGRLPEFRDGEFGTQKVVVVSEAFARVNWPGVDDPTGHRVRYNGGDSTDWHTVVGVLGDVRHYGLDQPPRPTLYFVAGPRNAKYFDAFAVVIRSRSTPAQLVEPVRRLVRELDPELPLYGVGTMEEQLQRSLAVWRVLATVLALFAAMALVLAVGGIYAVLSYLVGRRRIELGVRLALGAEPWQLVRLVVKQGLVLVGLGVLIGIPLAAGIAKLLSGKVVGLEIKDGVVWGVALVVIVATGVMAAAIPGRRAALVDPRTTLVGD